MTTSRTSRPVRFRALAILALAVAATVSACVPDPVTPPTYPRTMSVSWGASTSVTGCSVNCQRMVLDLTGWPPNTTVVIACQYHTGDGVWRSDFGYTPPALVTDGNGNATTGNGPAACVGSPVGPWEYRFVADGIASPPLG